MEDGKGNATEMITGDQTPPMPVGSAVAQVVVQPDPIDPAVPPQQQRITADNCYELLTKAKRQRLAELKENVYRYMSDNFLLVLRTPGVYGRLTGAEREEILARRMEGGDRVLAVAEINEVYDRVGSGGSRPPSRESSRPQSPLVSSSSSSSSSVSVEETTAATTTTNSHCIFYYCSQTKEWKVLTKMPEELLDTKGAGICTMYNYLFVAGGIRGGGGDNNNKGGNNRVSAAVFCYNPATDHWSRVRPLTQARSQLKLVSMEGHLYAIGGECLFTVERYDPRADRWSPVAPLPKGAFAVAHEAVATGHGELFVSGGSLFYRLLRYDSRRDEWEECPFNNSRGRSTDMVAHKSFVYRFDVSRSERAGEREQAPGAGITVFKYNTVVKVWHDGTCFPVEHSASSPFRCAVIGDRIYCVNKSRTLQFAIEEDDERFLQEALPAPTEVRGPLVPFVLTLDKRR